MIVYRVETEGRQVVNGIGRGPYASGSNYSLICSDSFNSQHPQPYAEPALRSKWSRKHVCCFTSIEELRRWFDLIDEVPTNNTEFKISTYHVPNEYFVRGRWQAIAKAEHMTLVETNSIHFKG